ncbi:MAG: MlaD family protein [Deltaproteobacteria bacterium]
MADKSSLLKFSPEAKVGLFVLLGIVLLVYMSLRIGGIKFGRAEGYTLTVDFDSASGLDKDAAVRVAGVEVGRIRDIALRDSRAHLVLEIKPGIKVRKDFTAVLTTKGLLGEKYLELIPGSPNAPLLNEGDEITRTTSYVDMDRLLTILSDVSKDIKGVTESLNKVLGGPEGEQTLKNIVKNIEAISFSVNSIVSRNDEKLGNIMKNLDEFTTLLKNDGPELSADLKLAIKNLNEGLVKTSGSLNQMIEENRGNFKEGVENLRVASLRLQEAMENVNKVTKEIGPGIAETVNSVGSIARKIDRGEGTIGKLINDGALHENINKTVAGINNYIDRTESIHTFIGYRGEFLFDARDTKSYFSLRIQPRADKYYIVEIIDDPRGKRKKETRETTVGSTTVTQTETTTTDALKFSAQIAKRFKDVTLRGGIIESTGGAGMDYYMFKERLKFTLEAFDFSQKGNPHLKASATYRINKYFYLVGGYDDILSKYSLNSSFLGMGFQFDDDDLKYILSSAPPVKF